MDASGPEEVIPPTDWQTAEAGVKLRYAGGIEVEHIKENGVTFFGSDGEVYVNRGKLRLTVKGAEKAKFLGKEDKPALSEQLDTVEKEFLANAKVKLYVSTDHKEDFLGAIQSRKKPIADVEIGARSVTACHLVNLGYYHGQKLNWDAKQNRFLKGTGSSTWLTREYRGDWRVA
jgi:hypothetical protein